MAHIRRRTTVVFGFSIDGERNTATQNDLRQLLQKIKLVIPFEVHDFACVSQRAFEQGTNIVTCMVTLGGHVIAPTMTRYLERIRRYTPERAYAFTNVSVLPAGANPNLYQH